MDTMIYTEDYPINLLDELAGGIWEHELPADFAGSLEYVLAGFSERDRRVIYARFRDKKTLDEIADSENLSRERIRQIIAAKIKKLKHPIRLNYLIYGVKGMEAAAVQKAISSNCETALKSICEIADKLGNMPVDDMKAIAETCETAKTEKRLDELDLSVRCYNCLKRANYETLGDVCSHTRDEISKIRNLGQKAFNELDKVVHKHGLKFKDE